MNRRTLLATSLSAAAGGIVAIATRAPALAGQAVTRGAAAPLPLPKSGPIRVCFVVSDMANVIDLAGAWETFQDVSLPDGSSPFDLSVVAQTQAPVAMTGGLKVMPDATFASLPAQPNVIVVGAQTGNTPAFYDFLRAQHGKADVIMSVCTGAFRLGHAGLLDGKSATTHHEFYDQFAKQFPKVTLVRGVRFVDNGDIITAGGLTSGIEAALHVVDRYYGATTSTQVADYLEFVPTARPS
jgi:transcriptional regulator GlxA family with amidase domain